MPHPAPIPESQLSRSIIRHTIYLSYSPRLHVSHGIPLLIFIITHPLVTCGPDHAHTIDDLSLCWTSPKTRHKPSFLLAAPVLEKYLIMTMPWGNLPSEVRMGIYHRYFSSVEIILHRNLRQAWNPLLRKKMISLWDTTTCDRLRIFPIWLQITATENNFPLRIWCAPNPSPNPAQ